MKKVIALLLICAMTVSLFGCGSEKAAGPAPGTALSTFYQAVIDA